MDVEFKLDEAFLEIQNLSEKTHALIKKSNHLIHTLDEETKLVKKHIDNIKKILGVEDKKCSICCKGSRNYCL